MTELMRFWRSIPRLLVGIVIALEAFVIIRGPSAGLDIKANVTLTRGLLGEGANGVLLAATVGAAAATFSMLSRAVLLPLRHVLGHLLRAIAAKLPRWIADRLENVAMPPGQLAVKLFESNEPLIYDVYRGSSLAATNSPALYRLVESEWDRHFDMIRSAMARLKAARQELWLLPYFGNVAQEQAFADYIESTVESIQVTWLALVLLPFAAARMGSDNVGWLAAAGVLAAVTLLPTFVTKKLTLATYFVHSIVMIVQFGRLADVSETDLTVE